MYRTILVNQIPVTTLHARLKFKAVLSHILVFVGQDTSIRALGAQVPDHIYFYKQ